MNKFIKELYQGLIHFRDRHQFELKSEFLHQPGLSSISYTQEFYLFIPESLQINPATYPKEQFYRDQTNFIRFKTPVFSLKELTDPNLERSPLSRLQELCSQPKDCNNEQAIYDEGKLLGNVVRSAIRERARDIVTSLQEVESNQEAISLAEKIEALVTDISAVQARFWVIKEQYMASWEDQVLRQHLSYVDRFIRLTIDFHLTGILKLLRRSKRSSLKVADASLCELIAKQQPLQPDTSNELTELKEEYFHYQRGLLNKFVMGALRLNIRRRSLIDRYRNIIAMTAAGIAMLVFLIGVAVQGNVFLVNSAPFIVITTLLYIIKDRIKEGLKTIYQTKASIWFPDYCTEIYTPSGRSQIGSLREVFTFVPLAKLPKEIEKVRNREFHNVLETFRRPEQVIYYRTHVTLDALPEGEAMRRYDLNTIFRLNIHRFLEKASDAHTSYTSLDLESGDLVEMELPKVYHINIIVRNSYSEAEHHRKVELQKFRLVIDKDGIKRVEQNLP